jgi:hypothetical protein
VQDILRATVREAGPVEMKPGYNGGEAESNQRVRLSDETGTITAYLTGGQELHNGDAIEICCVKGQRGMSGAAVKISGQGQRYLALYQRGVRLAGVSRQQERQQAEDPSWLTEPRQQGVPPARPQQQALPVTSPARPSPAANGRRTSREMEEWLLGVTERLFVGLSDSLTNSAPEGARLECAQSMAVSLAIAIGRGEIDYVPESKLAPGSLPERPIQEAPPFEGGEGEMDWGSFGQEEGN